MWIITSGRPVRVFAAYEARGLEGWPAGFWQTRRGDALRIVVARELPATRETLILRLLGRKATLDQAVDEFFDLPKDDLLVRRGRSLVLAFLAAISHHGEEGKSMNTLREWQALGEKIERRIRLEGQQKGARGLLKHQVACRFGPLPNGISRRIDAASDAQVERWTERIFDATTLDELLEEG